MKRASWQYILMRKYTGATFKDIGARFGMNSSGVSSIILKTKQATDRDKKPRQRIIAAEKLLTLAVKRLLMGDPLSLLKR